MRFGPWILFTVLVAGFSTGCDKASPTPTRALGGNCDKDDDCEKPLFCAVGGKVVGTCTLNCTAHLNETMCKTRFGDGVSFCGAGDNVCYRVCRSDSECEGGAVCAKHPVLGNHGEVGHCRHGRGEP